MNISKIHLLFAAKLLNPEAIDHPEDFLGSNYQAVLDFWVHIESLNFDELNEIGDRYCTQEGSVQGSAYSILKVKAKEIVGQEVEFSAWLAAYELFKIGEGEKYFSSVFGWATLELIVNAADKVFYDLIMNQ